MPPIKYYEKTSKMKPNPMVVGAVEILSIFKHRGKVALDLGAGAGRDSKYLLRRGYKVTAIDRDPNAIKFLRKIKNKKLNVVQSTFEDFKFGKYDLVSAMFSLPFTPPKHFSRVFSDLKRSIKPGGLFVGQLFGVNDQWNTPEAKDRMTFHTLEEVEKLFSDTEVINEIHEDEKDGKTTLGEPKHWHVFYITAQKPV